MSAWPDVTSVREPDPDEVCRECGGDLRVDRWPHHARGCSCRMRWEYAFWAPELARVLAAGSLTELEYGYWLTRGPMALCVLTRAA